MVAAELDIELPEEGIEEHILPAIKEASSEIENFTNTMGFQWYHVRPEEREVVLTNYLKQLGYVFTSEQVRDVVNRKSNRRVGNRPVKSRKKRLE